MEFSNQMIYEMLFRKIYTSLKAVHTEKEKVKIALQHRLSHILQGGIG
jgi:hypothetical protein